MQVPSPGLHIPAVHAVSRDEQSTGVPPLQEPPEHEPPSMHGSAAWQERPSARGTEMQLPSLGSHAPTEHAVFSPEQLLVVPWQTPFLQVSADVHAFPSSQGVPLVFCLDSQAPVVGSHAPKKQAESKEEQSISAPLWQTPWLQLSSKVQGFESSQAVPSSRKTALHTPSAGSQAPAVHAVFEAEQSLGVPPVHAPAVHESPIVHGFASSQVVPSWTGIALHAPSAESQAPTEQAESSPEQSGRWPPVQTPAEHVSVAVHASPSSQEVPSSRGTLTHSHLVPGNEPSLHTDFMQVGASRAAQSTLQESWFWFPAPPPEPPAPPDPPAPGSSSVESGPQPTETEKRDTIRAKSQRDERMNWTVRQVRMALQPVPPERGDGNR